MVGSSFKKVLDLCIVGSGVAFASQLPVLAFLGELLLLSFMGDGLLMLPLMGDVTLLSSFLGELVLLSDFIGELERLSGLLGTDNGVSLFPTLVFLETVADLLGVCFWDAVCVGGRLTVVGLGGGALRGATFAVLDGVDLAALAAVGWVRVLRRWMDGLGGTWGALAAKSRLRRRDGLPLELCNRPCWFMPGLEFRDESEELMMGLLALCLVVGGFLGRMGAARGRRLEGSTPGVSSFIRVLKLKSSKIKRGNDIFTVAYLNGVSSLNQALLLISRSACPTRHCSNCNFTLFKRSAKGLLQRWSSILQHLE